MMDDLTAFQRDLLYVIAGMEDDPYPHGLSIKEEIEKHYSNEVNHGRLYPNLDQLVEMGLVEKGEIDDRTNSYTLTERGASGDRRSSRVGIPVHRELRRSLLSFRETEEIQPPTKK